MPILTNGLNAASPLLAVQAATLGELGVLIVLTVSAVAVALAAVVIVVSAYRLRGTTLLAPVLWVLVSLATMVIVDAVLLRAHSYRSTRQKFDFIAVTSTFCPLIALLGAKRPQNRPWPCIVVSLWGICAWPAVESLITQPGEWMEIHPLWQSFYGILILAGCVNYLPTRFWGPALLAAAGQCALLCDWLPGASVWLAPVRSFVAQNILPEVIVRGRYDFLIWEIAIGIVPIAVAVCLAYIIAGKRRRSIFAYQTGWSRVWIDFRNAYGLIWSMRVVERMKATIMQSGTHHFDWNGMSTSGSDAQPETDGRKSVENGAEPFDSLLRSLLLRFVSNDWIDRRLHPADALPPITA